MKRPIHWSVSSFLLSIAFSVAFYGIAIPPVTKNVVLALCVLAAGIAAYFVTFCWRLSLRRVATFVVVVALLSFPVGLLLILGNVGLALGPSLGSVGFHLLWGLLILFIASAVSYHELRARRAAAE
jgi:hypothetical protein